MTKEEIGKILKELRINAGKTQIQVADQIGRSQQVIGHWETGYSQPDANTLFTLCDLYHADIDEAFGLNKNAKDRLVIFDPHEQKVITAYRAQPKMQEPVDKLLGIWESKEESEESYKMKYELEKLEKKEAKEGFIQKAAYGGKGVETDTLSTEEIAEIKEMARQMDMDKKGRGNY